MPIQTGLQTTVENVPQGGDATLLGREKMDGIYIKQATITKIDRTITDITDPDNPVLIDTSEVDVETAVFDNLQTDGYWGRDVTGYNFRDVVAAAHLAAAKHKYRIEYKFTGSGSQTFWDVFELFTKKIYGAPVG